MIGFFIPKFRVTDQPDRSRSYKKVRIFGLGRLFLISVARYKDNDGSFFLISPKKPESLLVNPFRYTDLGTTIRFGNSQIFFYDKDTKNRWLLLGKIMRFIFI